MRRAPLRAAAIKARRRGVLELCTWKGFHSLPHLGATSLGVDRAWTKDDADVIEFPSREEENDDLPGETDGGRYWDRTSDLCRVNATDEETDPDSKPRKPKSD